MKKIIYVAFAFVIVALFLSSCLTIEKKSYTFELTGSNAGKLTIKYYNIMSSGNNDTTDETKADFDELTSGYVLGDKMQNEYPTATNINKRLFEENGQLCGEVTLDFPDLKGAKLFQYDKKSPVMMYLSSMNTEYYLSSNGLYGGDVMPVVFWSAKTKKLELTTSGTKPGDGTKSLLDQYKAWKK